MYQIHIPRRLIEMGKDPNLWNGNNIVQVRFDAGSQAGNCKVDWLAFESYPHPVFTFNNVPGATVGHAQGWYAQAQISNWTVTSSGTVDMNITGGDPYFAVSPMAFDPAYWHYVVVRQRVTGFANNDPAGMQTFGFSTSGTCYRDFNFYPNVGYTTLVVDMFNPTGGTWAGTINTWRIDPCVTASSATFSYDSLSLSGDPAPAAPYTWNMEGGGQGTWQAAKHGSYGGSAVNFTGGAAVVTGSGTLAMLNLDMALNAASGKWLTFDMNPVTPAARNDFKVTFQWAADGSPFGAGAGGSRQYTFPTNTGGMKTYKFYLPNTTSQPSSGSWAGYPHGLLYQFGAGEAITSVALDNVNILGSLSAPTITGVKVQSGLTVDVTFSQQMAINALNANQYAVSGAGQGSLNASPSSVTYLYGQTYRLTWSGGEMVDGGTITITASNVQDAAGTSTSSTSGSHTNGGIGVKPTVTTAAVVNGSSVDVTFSETMGAGVNTASNYTVSGSGKGTLSNSPASVASQGANRYRLTWSGSSNEMKQGGDIVIAVNTSNVKDTAGNVMGTPSSGTAAAAGIGTAPNAGLASSVASTKTSPIVVNYSGASDAGSGLASVELWYKKTAGGAWTYSTLSAAAASGTFNFAGMSGDETYYFDLVAVDAAGNRSADASANGDTNTVYDTNPPVPGTITSPAVTKNSPIALTYTGAVDAWNGVSSYQLWYKLDTGSWVNSGIALDAAGGAVNFTPPSGTQGTYNFDTVAVDGLGNSTATPSGSGDDSTVFDTTPPTIADPLSVPAFRNTAPVNVTYSGVQDTLSGVANVALWYKKEAGGTWTDSGVSSGNSFGTFGFTPSSGDGTYYFGLVAADAAGNTCNVTLRTGSTVYDTVKPAVGTLNAPDYGKGATISIAYNAASDVTSGIAGYQLWYKYESGGTWADSGLTLLTGGGSAAFAPPGALNGTYYFALRAVDNAGNASDMPTGNGTDSTLYETVAPNAGTASAPAIKDAWPITVTYSGASDTGGSGLASVTLWYKKNIGGAWTSSGLTSATADGQFAFNQSGQGDGRYYFDLVATDNAGNASAPAASDGDCSTILDTTAPNPGTAAPPAYANTTPVAIPYSGASDGGSGLASVALWYKKGSAGEWQNSGLTSTAASGSFAFNSLSGDDLYYFDLVATDNAGHASAAASGTGDGQTIFDTTAPVITITPQAINDTTPIISGSVEDLSGIQSMTLSIAGRTGSYTPVIDGTVWSVQITSPLPEGTYNVVAQATDMLGQTGSDSTTGELIIDLTVPTITVTPLITSDTTPVLSGTVQALAGRTIADVTITVNEQVYNDEVAINGTEWSLQITTPIPEGVYNVEAKAVDSATRIGTDGTTGELTIDITPPEIHVEGPDSTHTTGDPVSYTVTYLGAEEVTLTAGDVTLLTTGDAAADVVVSEAKADFTRIITLDNFTGSGDIALKIEAGTARDEAGNTAPEYVGGYALSISPYAVPVQALWLVAFLPAAGVFAIRKRRR